MPGSEPIVLDDAIRSGKDLKPIAPWPDAMQLRPITSHRLCTWFEGEKLTSMVYEAEDGLLRFDDLPYDEQVCLLSGTAVLTSDGGKVQTFTAGDVFVVPKGWSGTWELKDGYRELITFEKDSITDAMTRWGLE